MVYNLIAENTYRRHDSGRFNNTYEDPQPAWRFLTQWAENAIGTCDKVINHLFFYQLLDFELFDKVIFDEVNFLHYGRR
jgi:hypothetical protein